MSARHRQIWDLVVFTLGMLISLSWSFTGYPKEALILATVSYWGLPWTAWRNHLDQRHTDGSRSGSE